MTSMTESLDQLVRRIDEDRWLASRFAPDDVRARLIAIYAVNYEIARTADTVTQGAIGDIRLAWWREALVEIHGGKPARAHPVLQAYAHTAREVDLPLAVWDRLIEARGKDLDATPFAGVDDLDAYLEATAGGVMRLALAACAAEMSDAFTAAASRAWGCAGLLRSEQHWRARGRSFLPSSATRDDLVARATPAFSETRKEAGRLPAAAFPALGYVAFVPGYLRALRSRRSDTPVLARQLRLIGAAATGRL
jgi:phytoene synthase